MPPGEVVIYGASEHADAPEDIEPGGYERRRMAVHECVRTGDLATLSTVLNGSYGPRAGGWFRPPINFLLMGGSGGTMTKTDPAVVYPIGPHDDSEITLVAAQEGHLDVLGWARDVGIPWHPKACNIAAERGQLSALRWAQRHGAPADPRELLYVAARSGSAVTLEACVDDMGGWQALGAQTIEELFMGAARSGSIEVVRHIHDSVPRDGQWQEEVAQRAARGGHRQLLEWAVARQPGGGGRMSARIIEALAARGDIETIDWARSQGLPWDHRAALAAIGSGQTSAEQTVWWLAANGAPIDHDEAERRIRHYPADQQQRWRDALAPDMTLGG